MQKTTTNTRTLAAADQRTLILDMFFDGDDPENFLALIEHTGIDLAAAGGDVSRVPHVILGHYRVKKGCYDIDRAATDLATFPPVADYIAELEARIGETSYVNQNSWILIWERHHAS